MPQPFDEDGVSPGRLSVHADCDAVVGERAGEGLAGELRALVGVDYPALGRSSGLSLRATARRCRRRHGRMVFQREQAKAAETQVSSMCPAVAPGRIEIVLRCWHRILIDNGIDLAVLARILAVLGRS